MLKIIVLQPELMGRGWGGERDQGYLRCSVKGFVEKENMFISQLFITYRKKTKLVYGVLHGDNHECSDVPGSIVQAESLTIPGLV